MKTLYLECTMGAAGDMLTAALFDLMDPSQQEEFLATMNGMGLEGVQVTAERDASHGICGTHMHVLVHGVEEGAPHKHHHQEAGHDHHEHEHHHNHAHATPSHIADTIDHLALPEHVRSEARAVYDAIAHAEAKVHGTPVSDIHYHEVGALDAVADVCGFCLALDMIAPDEVVASPVHVGSGTTVCAHGTIPVPAPATSELLRGVPTYAADVEGELCTPTGAALLAHFATSFGPQPLMAVDAIGCGIGTKDFGRPNVLRAFLGEAEGAGNGEVVELVCNIDDMTPEALAFACARLVEGPALDAYVTPGTMKKGRPGHELTVICAPNRVDETARAVLRETTTNGLRVHRCEKYSLAPRVETVQTEWGPMRVKVAEGFGVRHVKPEYEDVARVAAEQGLPIGEVDQAVRRAHRQS